MTFKPDAETLRLLVQTNSAQEFIARLKREKPEYFHLPKKARIALLIFAAFWLAFSGSAWVTHLAQPVRECLFVLRAQPVAATIKSVDRRKDSVLVTAEYRFGGQARETQLRLMPDHPLLQAHPEPVGRGSTITLYCDPWWPADARVSRKPNPQLGLGSALFLCPFVCIGLGMLYGAAVGRLGLGAVRAAGFILIYTPLCCVSAFVLFVAEFLLPPTAGLAVGMGMILVYPLVALAASGAGVRMYYRKARAKAIVQLQDEGEPLAARVAAEEVGQLDAAPPRISPAVDAGLLPPPPPSSAAQRHAADAPGEDIAKLGAGSAWSRPPDGRLSGCSTTVFLAVFGVFWCGMTSVFAGTVVHALYKHAVVQLRYAATEGTVVSSKLTQSSDGEGTSYHAEILYRYTVAGKTYDSNRYAFGSGGSSVRAYHQGLVDSHRPGAAVTVFYDPSAPGESVLSRSVERNVYFLALFLQPFLMVAIGFIVAALRVPRARRSRKAFFASPASLPCEVPTWGPMTEDIDGIVIRGGAPRSYFLTGLGLGWAGACFVLIFLIGFLFDGFGAPNPFVLLGAVVLAAIAAVIFGRFMQRRLGRKAVVTIDRTFRCLRVQSPARNENLPLDQMRCWLLRMIRNPRRLRRVDAPIHVPMLCAVAVDGRELPVHVFAARSDSTAIARRAGEILSGLTAKPLRAVERPGDEPSTAAGGDLRDLS